MRKFFLSRGIAAAVILVALISFFAFTHFTENNESSIKNEIEKANYCNTKEDCAYVGSECPFGCYIYVNNQEADRIKDLIDSFNSACIYSCISCSDFECVDGKCKEVCEQ